MATYCPRCATRNPADARFCTGCGVPLSESERALVAEETGHFDGAPEGAIAYGGFWRRVGAYLIDALLLVILFSLLQWVLAPETLPAEGDDVADFAWTWWDGVVAVCWWLYSAGLHSSPWQATLGKRALGMQVTDRDGERIGFGRATLRHLGEFLSGLLLFIGYLMVAFTRRKQGLHDLIAGTLVVVRRPEP